MATSSETTKPKLKVLSLGLPRTGSASIARALRILGFEKVLHGLGLANRARLNSVNVLNRAADASYPALPTYTGKELSLEDWQELYWDCEASTDIAGLFAPQLIKCYPDAKVILVIRPFDEWYESINDVVFNLFFGRTANFLVNFIEPLHHLRYVMIARKVFLGFFNAQTIQEVRQNARSVYDNHHARIKMMKPASELLIFDLGDGWEPLCRFLDKPIPPEPFPRINDRAATRRKLVEMIQGEVMMGLKKCIPWVTAAVAIYAYAFYFKSN